MLGTLTRRTRLLSRYASSSSCVALGSTTTTFNHFQLTNNNNNNNNNHQITGSRFKSSAVHKEEESSSSISSSSSSSIISGDVGDGSVMEVISFPSSSEEEHPVLLNSQEHAVGYLSKILNAKVYEVAKETELQHAKNLSAVLNNKVMLKREDTQPVFSFKIRGAYNKMANLTREELDCGVVACSAGNHAQGVALSARVLDCHAVIVMPLATPSIKINAVRQHGGSTVEVRLFGNNYDEAAAEAKRLQMQEGMSMIHPFDDPYVIAGQGTIGMEILKSSVSTPLDAIFVCCGGGGMLAGIAAYVKRVRPNVKVIGVEAADAAGMTASLREGQVVTLDSVGLFADGAAVKTIGSETFRICNKLVDDMITVSTDQICNAIKLSYNDARVILEPAGALGVAGMKKYIEENNITGQTLVAITSGANMDFDRLRFVSERADGSERTLAVTIPETAGTFRALYELIWPRNVTQFSYRFESESKANILISFQPIVNIENDFDNVVEQLNKNDFKCLDISENELAKVHIRHMAGGRSIVPKERLFRFNFPESPGALQRFLTSLDMDWNVSLFHYRNHGDDVGRVLVGIQVGRSCQRLHQFLDNLGYSYVEETDNAAYLRFLRNSDSEEKN
eukprot:CAMPEP_0197823400 /NCGR_PEP_ID=MMETSP1437-20131217/726_1 /TAXON_ID=49252 ORGANISM="Eucampia antarctica, Strain CCMP1452" /NCGR_SAMPLE_ID=MMETSP1437 /ASSEMBLY_ACC=CAM_ASM_001096 /LENGTH=621 /DNA_ID=CAMNT_0043422541 /DNA_START=247 /DNA_END=2112 /DNA_ORIENTATION=+